MNHPTDFTSNLHLFTSNINKTAHVRKKILTQKSGISLQKKRK
uniref:Uncharacterized protein n=1 Tax=Candidatus Nitrotoga fabula TaxID=2182327 RepID=A0A2X0SGH6_9PROT|nr:protein of unknown function [Candidatus Nitrotoga fabula]